MIDFLRDILFFNPAKPLIFTRFYFWAFFIIVLFFYSFIAKNKNKTIRAAYLFLISIFFYYKSSGVFFVLLLFSTVFDFYIGKWVYESRHDIWKKILISFSILVNIGLLAYFKYSYFFVESLNQVLGTQFEVINYLSVFGNTISGGNYFDIDKIILPVGISFYTFQTISYSIDIYRKELKPVDNLIDFGFFVSFFPQLVAGPIVRASQFIPQMYKDFKLSKMDFGIAIFWIMKGLVKKIYIGDYIAVNFVDRIFDAPLHYTGFENLMALIGYSLQVYVDFSGYTDVAIGVAILLGFTLPMNFNSPYKAKNVADFWKRWHISLSTWLKDYLYIPMGGNRGGSVFSYTMLAVLLAVIVLLSGNLLLIPVFVGISIITFIISRYTPGFNKHLNTNINLLLTMLIGGLWHGASWQFIIWGGLNGLGLVTYKYWRKISPYEKLDNWVVNVWKISITFMFITFTRVFFRAETMEVVDGMMSQIYLLVPRFSDFTNLLEHGGSAIFVQQWSLVPSILLGYKWVFVVMLIGFIFHWLPYKLKDLYEKWFVNLNFWLQTIVFSVVVFVVYQSVSADMVPFIYFQF